MNSSRREFLHRFLAAAALPMAVPLSTIAGEAAGKEFKVLFQGDSITDGNRGRSNDPNHILGHGYAFSVAAELGAKYPERGLQFVNKGISGDKISDLMARWKTDALELNPDLISILIGINDILKLIGEGGTIKAASFEKQYRELLAATRIALPDAILVIGEPFILPVGMVAKDRPRWDSLTLEAQAVTAALARDHDAIFLPYQKIFTDAAKRTHADYWIWDGIHPTYSGHGLMKDAWIREVTKRCKELR